tara:strand:+ start:1837 stop:2769 length:933 start_codon:yes stop_codon:yes gene_type:complete
MTIVVALITGWWWQTDGAVPSLGEPVVYTGALTHPAQVIRVGDAYLGGELFSNDLVLSESLGFEPHQRMVLRENNKDEVVTLESPHFFEPLGPDRVLVSEGWGSNIALIDLESGEVSRFGDDQGRGLYAPHGICLDISSGWVYVADSLHSRLVRYRPRETGPAEIFADHRKLVSYGRQLICDEDGLWLSNSYEEREGLNPGRGSNVLHINDFTSGEATVVADFPEVNMTGLARLNRQWLVVGLWGTHNQLVLVPTNRGSSTVPIDPIAALPGPPYGLFFDRERSELLATYIGAIHDRTHPGGLAVYPVQF